MNKHFEKLIGSLLHDELSEFINKLLEPITVPTKKYLTLKEVSTITGIGSYTLRQLTFARAMPHRKIRSRLVFDESEINETITHFKTYGWSDPKNTWDIEIVQSEIENLRKKEEKPKMIDEIIREIVREELANFSSELRSFTKKDKESYYGRTILTVKEAAEHFRTSPATIYSLIREDGMPHIKIHSRSYIVLEEAEAFLWRETAKSYADIGNIYWQKILQRLDWEEKERTSAYQRALKRLEEQSF